ncbi:protein-arginine deiminase type-2 isoform X2 [Cynoglossus semilaevis]|uniref:protein-arginine deiminase type-2 isoform X2 n=1 Tax=Cynoglossus semilaevis TaxID=244447 RepID=UPI000D6296D5|nr:protein-arginine deiminase type-2-like isoform X2 [Cynoglossus semilaevis]
MIHNRTLRLDYNKNVGVVYVVGSEINVNLDRSAPPKCKFFSVKCTPTVQYTIVPSPQDSNHHSPIPLKDNTVLLITMKHASEFENDSKLSLRYYGEDKEVLGRAGLYLTAVEVSLDVDADRDGVVEKNNPKKASWKWGPDGHGAILLVNCDSERTYWKKPDTEHKYVSKVSDLKDMSPMVLRTKGPAKLPDGYKLTLHISQSDAESVRIFRAKSGEGDNVILSQNSIYHFLMRDYPLVLSTDVLSQEVPYLGNNGELKFYVEGLRFLDKDFDGMVTINVSLLEPISKSLPETPIFTDKVVFRVAPWIMTPNTLNPVEVFVCSTRDNYKFLKSMTRLVDSSGYKLKVCHEYMNRGDRWMQDELEFGYIDSPHQGFPVVLDSPRDGKLRDFPYAEILGPDFGYVTRVAEREDVSSLDSFGNLEVSPPVTVNGKNYPLGRIIIGVAFPTATKGRNMTKVVQDFLWAQKVQEPVALFSDWLVVGHVDEFMTFVPAPDRKPITYTNNPSPTGICVMMLGLGEYTIENGPSNFCWQGFRLLLASPDAGYKLFRGLKNDGHGQAKLFEGLEQETQITVDELLDDEQLQAENSYVQSCIDWNRDVLKRELGLDDDDIIDLPILFKLVGDGDVFRALAYYPDMVNMIVLGKNLGIPKPFGPKVNGRCSLEAEMCSLMGGLGLNCTFIDDFASYHKLLGEVHCGSNVRREAFGFKWWNIKM